MIGAGARTHWVWGVARHCIDRPRWQNRLQGNSYKQPQLVLVVASMRAVTVKAETARLMTGGSQEA